MKTQAASRVVMTETALPGDGNALGTAFGGKIAQWIDVAAFRTSMEAGVHADANDRRAIRLAHAKVRKERLLAERK